MAPLVLEALRNIWRRIRNRQEENEEEESAPPPPPHGTALDGVPHAPPPRAMNEAMDRGLSLDRSAPPVVENAEGNDEESGPSASTRAWGTRTSHFNAEANPSTNTPRTQAEAKARNSLQL